MYFYFAGSSAVTVTLSFNSISLCVCTKNSRSPTNYQSGCLLTDRFRSYPTRYPGIIKCFCIFLADPRNQIIFRLHLNELLQLTYLFQGISTFFAQLQLLSSLTQLHVFQMQQYLQQSHKPLYPVVLNNSHPRFHFYTDHQCCPNCEFS